LSNPWIRCPWETLQYILYSVIKFIFIIIISSDCLDCWKNSLIIFCLYVLWNTQQKKIRTFFQKPQGQNKCQPSDTGSKWLGIFTFQEFCTLELMIDPTFFKAMKELLLVAIAQIFCYYLLLFLKIRNWWKTFIVVFFFFREWQMEQRTEYGWKKGFLYFEQCWRHSW
jgi:hypothetical protein